MFHAAGWTFPWSNVFSFATQVARYYAHTEASLTIKNIFRLLSAQSIIPTYGSIFLHLL